MYITFLSSVILGGVVGLFIAWAIGLFENE